MDNPVMRWRLGISILVAALLASPSGVSAADPGRGEYVFKVAGCGNCHTDPGAKGKTSRPKGKPLAGGRPLRTAFGVFYTPNITPHPDAGIGSWSFIDFRRAMVRGVAPNTTPYYPAFPYTSYIGMSDADLADLWAYIVAQKPSSRANQSHDLVFPFNVRALMHGWRLLFFAEGSLKGGDANQSNEWKRGAYIARALAHCGECHTPRNIFGAMDTSQEFAGNPEGPGGQIPGLTPANTNGIVTWSKSDIVEYLSSGMTPEGDFAGGEMAEVIDHSTAMLNDNDRKAIAVFLKSLN
tara:strand:- start:674 stop:1558 length:885 start_codon:yes stop_codon:yes gene_type:complete